MSWKNEVKNWNGKLYKVLQGNQSCHSGDFEWSLPEGDNPGDWTPVIEYPIMCERGYHLTTHYAHWSDINNISIYEAEGDVIEFDGYDKVVCSRARLLRLVENPFDNSGYRNSGNSNSGHQNSGYGNSGNRNSGSYNSGHQNSGYGNSGNRNSGSYNSGSFNSGNYNSGDSNSGYCNSGNRNSGNYNSGNRNSGSFNSGDWNSGDWNSGDWNSGDKNSGSYNKSSNISYFCTSREYIIFNKPAPKNWEPGFPDWMKFDLLPEGYHASWQKAFEGADMKGIKELLDLPNFDYEIFEEITSITKKQIEEKLEIDPAFKINDEEKSLRESAKVACEKVLGEFYSLIKNNVALPEILKMAAEKAFINEIEDENTDIIRKSLKVLEQDGVLV